MYTVISFFSSKNCLVVFKTNIPDFRKSEMEVYRRFSDFLGLHEKLIEKHLHRGCIVPPPPEKSVIGMLVIALLVKMDMIVFYARVGKQPCCTVCRIVGQCYPAACGPPAHSKWPSRSSKTFKNILRL